MEQEGKKRIRRSKEQITQDKISKLEAEIESYKVKIEQAEKKIQELKNTVTIKDIKEKIAELDLPLDDVMKAIEKMGKK